MYSIYRLKGYKSKAVASQRLCFSLLGDCGEAGAYAFSGCVIAVLSFELVCASGKWKVRCKAREGSTYHLSCSRRIVQETFCHVR